MQNVMAYLFRMSLGLALALAKGVHHENQCSRKDGGNDPHGEAESHQASECEDGKPGHEGWDENVEEEFFYFRFGVVVHG